MVETVEAYLATNTSEELLATEVAKAEPLELALVASVGPT